LFVCGTGVWTQGLTLANLQDRSSTTWVMLPAIFCSGYFEDRVLIFFPDWPGMVILLFYTSCHSCEDRHTPPHIAFFLWNRVSPTFFVRARLELCSFQSLTLKWLGWDGILQTFAWASLKLSSSDLSLPRSQDYRHESTVLPALFIFQCRWLVH
jgi:hypothetical protein